MTDQRHTVREAARDVPLIDRVDVLVAGSGPAGIAAALAAAREGARTMLVERYGYLGGMMTGAHVTAVLGVGDGNGPLAQGITAELQERLQALGAVTPMRSGDYRVDAEAFKWQAAEMLQEAGVRVRLHTLAAAPLLEDGRVAGARVASARVAGAFVESKSGREAIAAAVTVDATADADLAYRAGSACDDATHDVTLGYRLEGIDRDRAETFQREHPEDYEEVLSEAARRNGGVMLGQTRYLKEVDVADAEALTGAELLLRRDYFQALLYLKRYMPGWEGARLVDTYHQIGVRQGRRIRGLYVLTDEDLRASRHFSDGIARMGSYLLGYHNYGVAGLHYDVPYRCLVPEAVDGLLVAGRSISCDYLAGNTMRLIVPCLATGQAAGTASALAVREGMLPRDVDVTELRAALRRQDAYLGPEEEA